MQLTYHLIESVFPDAGCVAVGEKVRRAYLSTALPKSKSVGRFVTRSSL